MAVAVLLFSVRAGSIWDYNDLYWHVRMGQDIWEHHRLTGDPAWTFGPVGDPGWVTTQGLSELVMYGLWKVAGWQGFLALKVVAAVVFMWLTWQVTNRMIPARLRAAGAWRVAALIWIGMVVLNVGYLAERPQTLTVLMFFPLSVVATRLLLTGRWPHPLAVFAVTAVWAWFHGGALLVGPLLAAAWLCRLVMNDVVKKPVTGMVEGQSSWRWLAVMVAAVTGPTVNLIGTGMLTRASKIQAASSGFISEWLPVEVTFPVFLFMLILLAAWVAAAIVLSRRGAPLRMLALEGMWLVLLLAASLNAGRMLILMTIMMIPVVARRAGQVWPAGKPGGARSPFDGNKVVAVFLLVCCAVPAVAAVWRADGLPDDSPRLILSGLAAQDRTKSVFVSWNVAGQVQAFGGAGVVTELDGRTDRYGARNIEDYTLVTDVRPGWLPVWAGYPDVTDAVLGKDMALAGYLAREEGWRTVCIDGDWVWLAAPGVAGVCGSRQDPVATTGVS